MSASKPQPPPRSSSSRYVPADSSSAISTDESDRPPTFKTTTSSAKASATPRPDSSDDYSHSESESEQEATPPPQATSLKRTRPPASQYPYDVEGDHDEQKPFMSRGGSGFVKSGSSKGKGTKHEGVRIVGERTLGPAEMEKDAMARFYEEVSATHHDLDHLEQYFDQIRALSTRLLVLAPNDFAVLPLARELRTAIQKASKLIVDLDDEVKLHWQDENEVRRDIAEGTLHMDDSEMYEREHEFDAVAARFLRRVDEIKREAKGEKLERKETGARKEPPRLDDWLAESAGDISNLSKHDAFPPSRYTVTNPFTILARMTDGMESLEMPKMLQDKYKPPKSQSSKPSKLSPRPIYASSSSEALATPLSSDSEVPAPRTSRSDLLGPHAKRLRPFSWKPYQVRSKNARTDLEKGYDEISADVEQAAKDVKATVRFGNRERWIVFLTLALIPAVIGGVWIEEAMTVSDPDLTMKTMEATMMEKTGAATLLGGTPMASQGGRTAAPTVFSGSSVVGLTSSTVN